jgi:hypothetical protein
MIEKFGQFLFINFFCICILLIAVGSISEADPIVENITLIPNNPPPQSEVTFSVDIGGNSISSVWIVIFECNEETGICHAPPQNVSMRKVDGDTYEAEVTLEWDDVSKIKYNVKIKSDGEWFEYKEHITTLSTNPENLNDSNGSPGFEIIVFFISMIVVVFLLKKLI